MKKLLVAFFIAIILVACQSNDGSQRNNENKENEIQQEEEKIEEDNFKTEIEKIETNDEKESNESDDGNETNNSSVNEEENGLNNETSNEETNKDEVEGELIALGESIFQAQFDSDIDYLRSILSKGTKIEGETFLFENVAYPHEQDFLTEETAADIEFRYTHENDESSYIVGFAAIDRENEYSYVIDFEFIQADGNWKMNDMDINK